MSGIVCYKSKGSFARGFFLMVYTCPLWFATSVESGRKNAWYSKHLHNSHAILNAPMQGKKEGHRNKYMYPRSRAFAGILFGGHSIIHYCIIGSKFYGSKFGHMCLDRCPLGAPRHPYSAPSCPQVPLRGAKWAPGDIGLGTYAPKFCPKITLVEI